MYAGDEFYDDDITSGPLDHEAEREAMFCDRCMSYHGGDCIEDEQLLVEQRDLAYEARRDAMSEWAEY